ncbi:hypothetical protein L3Q72_05340 [Vibrio sp. JC009]|uniref:hypothetical protein n=1 Tax=Vibrio sp. JC009 TaxID=2912314 RepID=UPI0023B14E2C|nr:hypothetical protein [Vibrio sp. JC009]WED22817.1 hypothetical protein L3Q72_05340 [Vibrio sp. JC009]
MVGIALLFIFVGIFYAFRIWPFILLIMLVYNLLGWVCDIYASFCSTWLVYFSWMFLFSLFVLVVDLFTVKRTVSYAVRKNESGFDIVPLCVFVLLISLLVTYTLVNAGFGIISWSGIVSGIQYFIAYLISIFITLIFIVFPILVIYMQFSEICNSREDLQLG